jgi:hypothetical protein
MTAKQFYDWQTAGGTDDVMRLVDCLERREIPWPPKFGRSSLLISKGSLSGRASNDSCKKAGSSAAEPAKLFFCTGVRTGTVYI